VRYDITAASAAYLNNALQLTAYSLRSVRRESGMSECGNTIGDTGTRWVFGVKRDRPLYSVSSIYLKGIMRRRQVSKRGCLAERGDGASPEARLALRERLPLACYVSQSSLKPPEAAVKPEAEDRSGAAEGGMDAPVDPLPVLGSDSLGTRTREAPGETLRVPPRKRRKQGRLYNRSPGTSTADARGTEGSVGVVKRGNARGAQDGYGSSRLRHRGRRGAMTKTPISLQDRRRRIDAKAKAEPSWRFWGLYVHR
jgi:hypothetical protein